MESPKKKKRIIILSVVAVVLIGVVVYFSQKQWYDRVGTEGHFSKDTYLDGGTGSFNYSKNTRIHYVFLIESGSMHYELTDEEGNVVYEMDITESCDGYIPFDNKEPVTYYETFYATSDDTVAYTDITVQVQKSNFKMFLRHLNFMSNYNLFGPGFGDD